MLILSRREADKVLLPDLGITIEVTRVQGRTVHLGIDAPREFKIIRSELVNKIPAESFDSRSVSRPSAKTDCKTAWDRPQELQECLDAANLAIHLAQNQLRQQLGGKAEVALEHAAECLEILESALSRTPEWSPASSTIHESKTRYQRDLAVRRNLNFGSPTRQEIRSIPATAESHDDFRYGAVGSLS